MSFELKTLDTRLQFPHALFEDKRPIALFVRVNEARAYQKALERADRRASQQAGKKA